MAVAVLDAWSTPLDDEPDGNIAPSAGSSRCIVVAQIFEDADIVVPNTFTIGGVSYDDSYLGQWTVGSDELQVYFYWWFEDAISQMIGSSVNYNHGALVVTKRRWAWASYSGVGNVVATENDNDPVDTLDLTTTSTADDFIVIGSVRSSGNRRVDTWDTLTEQWELQDSANFAVAHGVGGDDTTTLTGDGILDDLQAVALVLSSGEVGTVPVITSVEADGIESVMFDGEIQVHMTGLNFGNPQGSGTLILNDSDTTTVGGVTQTITNWLGEDVVFTVDKGSLQGDSLFLHITNDIGGVATTTVTPVTVYDSSGIVQSRKSPSSQTMESGQSFLFDAGSYFYQENAQDTLTYSMTGAPSGISINSSTGIISGTIADNEHTSSPFTVDITATDSEGNTATDQFTWTVTDTGTATITLTSSSVMMAHPSNANLKAFIAAKGGPWGGTIDDDLHRALALDLGLDPDEHCIGDLWFRYIVVNLP